MEALPSLSERAACRVLHVARSSMRPDERPARAPVVDELLTMRVRRLIEDHPTYGYRHLCALLRRDGVAVNRKAVYRLLKINGWLVHQRQWTPRPGVQGRVSKAERSNLRWAMDVTHIPCGRDGWAHLTAVIDCCDREVIGYELAFGLDPVWLTVGLRRLREIRAIASAPS
jgi:putative transposase